MQFRDLKRQYKALKLSIDNSIQEVITATTFISGPHIEVLEERLSSYAGMRHCITCGNGTDALSMLLMAWDIKAGDAVFVPDFTFFATGEVVAFEGATPVFVDVDPNTFNMDPVSLEEAVMTVLEERILTPKVVIPVDLFGLPACYPEIKKVADKYGMKVLEDGAQGFGGMINHQRACSFGDGAATSFFPAKPLGCYGDGGAIFTNDDNMAAYLKSVRVHGKGSHKYENVRIGWNSRLDTIQGAIMLPKLKAFQEYELDRVNEAARLYTELLEDIVITPYIPKDYFSSWAQYTIQLKSPEERDGLQKYLKSQDIPTMIYYPIPMHAQRAFEGQRVYRSCPVTERLCKTVLSLPMHPYMEEGEIHFVAEKIEEFCKIRVGI